MRNISINPDFVWELQSEGRNGKQPPGSRLTLPILISSVSVD